jgi:hypothetical protein
MRTTARFKRKLELEDSSAYRFHLVVRASEKIVIPFLKNHKEQVS